MSGFWRPQLPLFDMENLMKFIFGVVLLTQLTLAASAQTPSSDVTQKTTPNTLDTQLKTATQESKTANTELLSLQEEAVKKASDSLNQLRQLYSEGLVARVEVEKAEQDLAAATTDVEQTKTQIANAEKLTAEIQKAAELAKYKPLDKPTLMSRNNLVMRSTGIISASLATNLLNVQQFFQNTFGRALPTSAIGQSETHDKMGWDHRNAFDIGIHPDSSEGQAVISFLKMTGIPFLAFRSAIPGVATGPHIHVGAPSHHLG